MQSFKFMQLNLHGQWISTSKWAGKHCLLFFHWLFDFIVQFIIVLDRGMHLLLDHSAICIMLASVADYASLFFSVLDNCQEILCWVFSLFFINPKNSVLCKEQLLAREISNTSGAMSLLFGSCCCCCVNGKVLCRIKSLIDTNSFSMFYFQLSH